MRTWGRVAGVWTEVSTAPNGDNSEVWLTTLAQTLLLYLNESPFFANYGIPARQSIASQVYPDLYVQITQQQFAPYFASLSIIKIAAPYPKYLINVTTFAGATLSDEVAIPI